MTWVSERNLVAAISNAGGFGVLACGAMSPDQLAAEIEATRKLTGAAVRRQPDRHAPEARGAGRRVPRARRRSRRAGGRPAAARHHDPGQGRRRQAVVLCPEPRGRKEADPHRCRRPDHRGHGGGRPYRPGGHQRAGAGDPAGGARGAGVRRRRHRPWRGHRRLSAHGRRRLPARHPFRLRQRIDRASELQAGLHPRQRPRCRALGADRSGVQGDPGPRARQPGHPAVRPDPGRGHRPPSSGRAEL